MIISILTALLSYEQRPHVSLNFLHNISLILLHISKICCLDFDGIIQTGSSQSIQHKNFVEICESHEFSHGCNFFSSKIDYPSILTSEKLFNRMLM